MPYLRLSPKAAKLLERFRRLRASADCALDKLDATAHELAQTLSGEGFGLREIAPIVSRDEAPLSHGGAAHMLAGKGSRRPWQGYRRTGGERG
jgi:hypothetical protein